VEIPTVSVLGEVIMLSLLIQQDLVQLEKCTVRLNDHKIQRLLVHLRLKIIVLLSDQKSHSHSVTIVGVRCARTV